MPDRTGVQTAALDVPRDDAFAAADMPAFAAAYADMLAGCRYLAARASCDGRPAVPPAIAIRRACNCLKELDRFFVLMIDAADAGRGAPHGQRAIYVRDGDAAARLCRIGTLHRPFARDIPRLRAIGRIRALASGEAPAEVASRPFADLALATLGHNPADQAQGAPFTLGDGTLAVIAAWYLVLAERLRAVIAGAEMPA